MCIIGCIMEGQDQRKRGDGYLWEHERLHGKARRELMVHIAECDPENEGEAAKEEEVRVPKLSR